jgi:D-xylose transport system permease protein
MSQTLARRAGSDTGGARRRIGHELTTVVSSRALIFVGVFVVLGVLFQLQSKGLFLTPRNLSLMLRQGALLAVVACGVSVLMIMSEIDLAIGSAVFLCGVVAATLNTNGSTPLLVVLAATILTGVILGAVQGTLVVILGIPSFIATLAGLLAFRGLGLLWTNAATVGPVTPGFQSVSESFLSPATSYLLLALVGLTSAAAILYGNRKRALRLRSDADSLGLAERRSWAPFARTAVQLVLVVVAFGLLGWIVGGYLGIPTALLWVAVVGGVLTLVMTKTVYGRNSFLVGANREGARYAGIKVRSTVFVGFLMMGALYGVGAILLTSRLASSTPSAGQYLELDAIAAAVIGGVSLRGGTGTVGGAAMGALLLTAINNGMSLQDVSSFSQLIIKAVILVLALGIDSFVARRSSR